MSSETAEYLRRAKALIDTPEKWWQGGSHGPEGKICSLTAVLRAGCTYDKTWPSVKALGRVVGESPISWQDAPGRTHAEVMAAFDAAVAAEEATP